MTINGKVLADRRLLASLSVILATSAWALPADAADSSSDSGGLEEIVVTAQKTEELIQNVPIPVSVLDTQALAETGQVLITDYYTQVPSLGFSEGYQSSSAVSLRGLPAVTQVDDLPYSSVPDMDPGNIERIETLRGPQGTLYGTSGLGGIVKWVTVEPSTDAVKGNIEANLDSVYNGYDLGYAVRDSVNIPIAPDFAIRAGSFVRQDPGYIDNPFLGTRGVNHAEARGGNLSALWTPMEGLAVRLTGIYQSIEGGNANINLANPLTTNPLPLPRYEQVQVAGMGPYRRDASAAGAVIKYSTHNVNLTYVSGITQNLTRDYTDLSPPAIGYSEFAAAAFPGYSAVPLYTVNKNTGVTQELRATTSFFEHFDVLVGGFYREDTGNLNLYLPAENPQTGAIGGQIGFFNFLSASREAAVFGDVTLRFTDAFDVQLGGRESYDRSNGWGNSGGPVAGCPNGGAICYETLSVTKSDSFTYLVTPRYKITPDWMIYARFASGAVPGGQNSTPGAPATYGQETTKDYDLGTKGTFLDNKLSIDASLYRINFVGIQNEEYINDLSFTGNAGDARSQGAEITVEAVPVERLRLKAWVVFADAKITDLPASVAAAQILGSGGIVTPVGAPFPDSYRFATNGSIDKDFIISDNLSLSVGGTTAYIGERPGPFVLPAARQYYPGYARTDLRVGATASEWKASLYLNNVANRYGIVSGDNQALFTYNRYIIQPRTVGITISHQF